MSKNSIPPFAIYNYIRHNHLKDLPPLCKIAKLQEVKNIGPKPKRFDFVRSETHFIYSDSDKNVSEIFAEFRSELSKANGKIIGMDYIPYRAAYSYEDEDWYWDEEVDDEICETYTKHVPEQKECIRIKYEFGEEEYQKALKQWSANNSSNEGILRSQKHLKEKNREAENTNSFLMSELRKNHKELWIESARFLSKKKSEQSV